MMLEPTTADLARLDMPSLLEQVAEYGFAWRDVARLVGVNVPAVQKWRNGGTSSEENRTSVAALLATCVLLTQDHHIQDVASWLETPIAFGYPITGLDLYAAEGPQLVFRLASERTDAESVLTAYDPNWREKYRSDFEVFHTEDGLAIRPKRAEAQARIDAAVREVR
jgi:hypothetical protein